MPFDPSGNFTRDFNWVQDRDDGIKILASRMDGEFDNFAAGMNVVFFRNGLVPMSGDLIMGGFRMTGLSLGTAGAPGLSFTGDTDTGIYSTGANKVGISTGNLLVGEFSPTGLAITGALAVSGAVTFGAIGVTGDLTLVGNLLQTGAQTVSGAIVSGLSVTAPTLAVDGQYRAYITGTTAVLNFDTNDFIGFNRAANVGSFVVASAGIMSWGPTGVDTTALRVGGNAVWHAGNFNPANYALLSGATFTGNIAALNVFGTTLIQAGGGSNGLSQLNAGDASHTGFVGFYNTAGTRQGYVGFALTNGALQIASDTGAGFAFTGGAAGFANSVSVGSTLTVTGNANFLSNILFNGASSYSSDGVNNSGISGSTAWRVVNSAFNTELLVVANGGGISIPTGGLSSQSNISTVQGDFLANKTGTSSVQINSVGVVVGRLAAQADSNLVFYRNEGSGDVAIWSIGSNAGPFQINVPTTIVGAIRRDTNFYMDLSSGEPIINFDANDYQRFTRGTNLYEWVSGGVVRMSLNSGGGVIATAFTPTSDERIKSDITDLDGAEMLDAMYALGGQRYIKGDGPEFGFIAQRVQTSALKELVGADGEGILNLNYNGVLAGAVAAMLHIDRRLKALEND